MFILEHELYSDYLAPLILNCSAIHEENREVFKKLNLVTTDKDGFKGLKNVNDVKVEWIKLVFAQIEHLAQLEG